MESRCLDHSADNNQGTANSHAGSAAPLINGGSNEGEDADTSDLVHGGNKASPDTFVLAVEVLQEVLLVGQQTTEQHSVETVHCLAEEADQEDEEE